MIELRNLRKQFDQTMVLRDINLVIERGDVIALIGPSGAGKSTLLRCFNRLVKPESGELLFPDYQIDLVKGRKEDLIELRKKTAMVFQQFNLFHKKTALENVMEGLLIVKKYPKAVAEQIAYQQLAKVGLSDKVYHYPKHLSGGQQQRVAIARAIAMEPELLLLDEPTSALDPELIGEVLETIQQLTTEGRTMLLASHEMAFVKSVASKVIFLDDAKIVEQGTPQEIFEQTRNERIKAFFCADERTRH